MTLDEAKRIVLEKYPDAEMVFSLVLGYYLCSKTNQMLSDTSLGYSDNCWLSAAHRIQKEK